MPILPGDASRKTRALCELAPIIPVIVIEEVETARPLAEALIAGGLPVLEVTLRTDAALEAISAMAGIDGGHVGAGTLLSPDDVLAAKEAGATFGVSPGATDALLRSCEDEGLPILPGAVTASEAMTLLARGYDMLKFFPAETSGGAAALRALGGPLPQISFCPTGGITAENAPDYLALDNVLCAGGSWVVPPALVRARAWDEIEALARAASSLRR
jgi:2-dehydro-3-deoxyphosphogluconate aldolase/(4S)-4-hydroxy-2-oxoglutarate aldolase